MRTGLVVTAALLAVGLAGCLSDDGMDGGGDGAASSLVQVDDPDGFFDGAWYDASRFSLDDLSPPVFDILSVEEVWVDVSDGTRIHNGVYRPDTDDPTPVFINFSPYHGDTAETMGDNFGSYMIDHFVPRGYTVVLSSVRGTGHSEGCFEVGSDREAQDLSEVVDFFAAQDWSNGMVAAGGKSYDSTTQNAAIAKFPTDNLRAIFHVSGITDMYEYTYHNGLPARADAAAFSARYGLGQSIDEYGAGAGSNAAAPEEDAESLQRLVDDVGCPELAEHVAFPVATLAEGSKNAYWQERDWNRFIGDSEWDGSIFFYHGFQDWNVQPSHILPWLANLPAQIDTKVWLHQDEENLGHLYPMRADWNLTMLRWLDTELKGIDTGFWDESRVQTQGSDGLWREAETWPPVADGEPFMLASTDPPVLAEATDVPLRYSGAPTITATVTPTTADPVFAAILYDEGPDGQREWRNEATLRVIYHQGLEAPVPVTPGTPLTITVPFYPQDDVLEAGHKWVLVFQDAEDLPRQTVVTPAQVVGLTVDLDSVAVQLPLADADAVLTNQPRPTDCFAC